MGGIPARAPGPPGPGKGGKGMPRPAVGAGGEGVSIGWEWIRWGWVGRERGRGGGRTHGEVGAGWAAGYAEGRGGNAACMAWLAEWSFKAHLSIAGWAVEDNVPGNPNGGGANPCPIPPCCPSIGLAPDWPSAA